MSDVNWKLSALRATRAELPLIIEAARYGDSVAYNELVSRCYQPVLRYCTTMGSHFDAHDLAQETFLRALKSTSLDTDVANLEAFMIHIARCVCADYVREISKTRQLHSAVCPHDTERAMTETDTTEIECVEMLSLLCDTMREAFVLTQLLGFTYEEASLIAKVPVGTIRSRVSRSREALQATQQQYL